MSYTVSFGSRDTNTVNRFCGPASDGPDPYRWEVYTDARGMNRDDVLALIAELAVQLSDKPAPTFEAELKFANDTNDMLLANFYDPDEGRDVISDTGTPVTDTVYALADRGDISFAQANAALAAIWKAGEAS